MNSTRCLLGLVLSCILNSVGICQDAILLTTVEMELSEISENIETGNNEMAIERLFELDGLKDQLTCTSLGAYYQLFGAAYLIERNLDSALVITKKALNIFKIDGGYSYSARAYNNMFTIF